jgi:hypothetical protein
MAGTPPILCRGGVVVYTQMVGLWCGGKVATPVQRKPHSRFESGPWHLNYWEAETVTLLIFPCRVHGSTYEQAQENVVAEMLKRGLTPTEEPNPKICRVQYGKETLWECYGKCEAS